MHIIPVYILFMLSGCTSLIFEVTWFQLLELVFGSTTLAISTILVAYMLGLGVGAFFAGRVCSYLANGVRTYGFIEISIGLYALAVPTLVALYPDINSTVTASLPFQLATMSRFLLSLAIFLVPTFLMGATLPVLIHALTHRTRRLVPSVAILYGVNTSGAVIGVLAATFVLLPAFGLHSSNLIAALLSILAGSIAVLGVAPKFAFHGVRSFQANTKRSWAPGHERKLLLVSFAVVGAAGLAYEVCWSRALGMVFGSSIYAFAITLAAFLAGIAAGSLLIRGYVKKHRPGSNSYIAGLLLLSGASYTVTALLPEMPDMLNTLFMRHGISTTWLLLGLLQASVLIMLVPALLLGAMFPLAASAIGTINRSDGGATIGYLYFINTMGAAFGAFITGFIMIPSFGIPLTVAVTASATLFCAALILLQRKSRVPSTTAVGIAISAVFILVITPYWNPTLLTAGVYHNPDYYQGFGIEGVPLQGLKKEGLIYYKEGVNSTVSVHRENGRNLDLRINGKTDASLGDMSTQVLLGQIPGLFGSADADRYLVIGLASGITTGSVTLYKPAHIDVLEIEPAVIEATHFFDAFNHRPLDNPCVRVITDDARAFMGTVREPYDVIVSEPSNPWLSGASSLFTKEFFQAARQALRHDGVLLQWLQLYGMDAASVRAVLNSLRSQFPYIYGFQASRDDTDLLILARQTPLDGGDLPVWDALPADIKHELNRIDLNSGSDLWSLLRLVPVDFDRIINDNRIENSDDNMFVALRSPWHLFDPSDEVLALFQPQSQGILAIDNVALSANETAALALSHLWTRNDLPMAAKAAGISLKSGESANGRVFSAEFRRMATPNETHKILSRLKRAVELQPGGFIPRLARARMLYSIGSVAKALEDVDVALEIKPEHWPARRLRMDILTDMGRLLEARTEAEMLLESPYIEIDDEIWADAAQLAIRLGKLADGAREMRHYLQLSPNSPEYWSLLENVLDHLGQKQQSDIAKENATRSAINVIRDEHRYARYLEQLGHTDEAIASLEEIVSQDPGYELARADLARLKGTKL